MRSVHIAVVAHIIPARVAWRASDVKRGEIPKKGVRVKVKYGLVNARVRACSVGNAVKSQMRVADSNVIVVVVVRLNLNGVLQVHLRRGPVSWCGVAELTSHI